jgi:Putative beta-lactamase-inhibitor-like, PepSY-like
MRKIFFVALVSVCTYATSFAQKNAPAAVIKAFNQKFPNASNVKWDKENAHEYEAGFTWNGIKQSANYSDLGVWLETESPIDFSKLPMKVQDTFNAKHKGANIKAVAKIETSKNITKYEVEFKHGKNTKEAFYDEEGNELK